MSAITPNPGQTRTAGVPSINKAIWPASIRETKKPPTNKLNVGMKTLPDKGKK